jgi:hypothetical protein
VDLHSLAAPQVAGVAALILSDPEFYGYTPVVRRVARDIKSIIRTLSYPRTEDEPAVIWNGVDDYDCCGCLRQRDNGSGQCSRSPTSTATSMSTIKHRVKVGLYANCYTLSSSLIDCEGNYYYINSKLAYLFTDPSRQEHKNI